MRMVRFIKFTVNSFETFPPVLHDAALQHDDAACSKVSRNGPFSKNQKYCWKFLMLLIPSICLSKNHPVFFLSRGMVSCWSRLFRNLSVNPGQGFPNLFVVPGILCSLLVSEDYEKKQSSVLKACLLEATFFWPPGLEKRKRGPTVTEGSPWDGVLPRSLTQLSIWLGHVHVLVHACVCPNFLKFIVIVNLKLCIPHIPAQSLGGGEEVCVYRFFF